MKLSPQWIRDFVDLTVDDRRLAEDLTGVGIAVEGISGSGADTVFEMEIGTNRPDAMNHYGVAREAAAIYDLPLKQFSVLSSQLSAKPSNDAPFPITVEEPQLCPRFSARVIRGTKIKAFSGEDCASVAVAGPAADQQCRRCDQLCVVGDRQAYACV